VLVQLAGGNDGLNTLIPYEDPQYYRLRPNIGIPAANVLRLSDTMGLHPSCGAMRSLFDSGKLAVVQNVGYPNPNRSHFRSTEIWETATEESSSTGWVGRFLDNACAGMPADDSHDPLAVHVTGSLPQTFNSEASHPTFGITPNGGNRRDNEETRRFLENMARTEGAPGPLDNSTFLKQTLMDALVTEKKVQRVIADYRPGTAYPGNPFATSLRTATSPTPTPISSRSSPTASPPSRRTSKPTSSTAR
jgi:uncharacterized protein (DUF1501 family)